MTDPNPDNAADGYDRPIGPYNISRVAVTSIGREEVLAFIRQHNINSRTKANIDYIMNYFGILPENRGIVSGKFYKINPADLHVFNLNFFIGLILTEMNALQRDPNIIRHAGGRPRRGRRNCKYITTLNMKNKD